MDKENIREVIIGCVKEYLNSQGKQSRIDESSCLFGGQSELDSMGLVNVLVDVEVELLDYGVEISLTSAEAMSQKISPFRTVETLAEYIFECAGA